jgi:putative membrane protein
MLLPRARLGALGAALLVCCAAAPAWGHGGERHPAGREAAAAPPDAPADPEAARVAAERARRIAASRPEDHARAIAAAWADPADAVWELDLHPSVVIGVALLSALYALGVGPLRRRLGGPRRLPRGPVACFAASQLLLLASLNGPLHHLGDYFLFSAHMLQHLLITLVFAPLFLLGLPDWLLRPLVRPRALFVLGRWLTRPVVAFSLYNAALVLWHMPVVYELAMSDHDVHIAQHVSFMVLAVIAFWPVAGLLPEFPRLSYLWQIGYLFVMQIPMIALGAFLTLAEEVLYPFYATAPRVASWLPALEDQQLGGLLMWLPGHLVLWIPMAVIFFRWVRAGSDEATGLSATGVVVPR